LKEENGSILQNKESLLFQDQFELKKERNNNANLINNIYTELIKSNLIQNKFNIEVEKINSDVNNNKDKEGKSINLFSLLKLIKDENNINKILEEKDSLLINQDKFIKE